MEPDEQLCNECKLVKNFTEFFKKKGKPCKRCKVCVAAYRRRHRQTPAGKISKKNCENRYRKNPNFVWTSRALFTRAKASAKQRGIGFSLTFEEYVEARSKDCFYCFNLLKNEKNRGIGLDRIDNSQGYNIDNVLACCGTCNVIRGGQLSVDEMKKVAELLIKIRNLSI